MPCLGATYAKKILNSFFIEKKIHEIHEKLSGFFITRVALE